MNKTNIGIGIIALVVVSLFALAGSMGTEQLSGASFVERYQKTDGAILLDVRTPGEFAGGHLEGAVNIDFDNPTFTSEIQKLDKSKPYFLYCRSGNRSGQAITIMKKEGFRSISELEGGIVSNQGELTLVTTPQTSEYVVDASDMVNGQALMVGISTSTLSQKEIQGLLLMREEEKLARDVYTTLGSKWGTRIFSNIASSEQTHTDAMKLLLDRYAIPDPTADNTVGMFRSPAMQKLYDDLTAKGLQSLNDALIVGATVEDLDIRDLDVLMKDTSKQDILVTYSNLQKGSRNHLRAFVRNISASGNSYTPQYISQEAFTSIMGTPQERGRI